MQIANLLRRMSFQEWGGTETVVFNTARELLRDGHGARIFCTSALDRTGDEEVSGIRISRFGYSYPYFPLSKMRRRMLDKKGGNPFSPTLIRALETEKADVIHCHTMGHLAVQACRTARRARIPFVMSLHGGALNVPEGEIREMCRPLEHSLNYGRLLDLVRFENFDPMSRADGIVCVGSDEYRRVAAKFPEKNVIYLPNGVDPERFRTAPDPGFRRRYGIGREKFVVLCVSRIDYQKNQMQLLKMMKWLRGEMPDLHLLLVGPITATDYFARMKAYIAENALEECVTIIPGFQPSSPELVAAYRCADLFVLPSRHEPFGIVVLEAWSAGLPVVAARVGGLEHLVRDGENGLAFDSADLNELIEKCRSARADRELRGRICEGAERDLEENYRWPRIVARLEAFYEELCNEKRR